MARLHYGIEINNNMALTRTSKIDTRLIKVNFRIKATQTEKNIYIKIIQSRFSLHE